MFTISRTGLLRAVVSVNRSHYVCKKKQINAKVGNRCWCALLANVICLFHERLHYDILVAISCLEYCNLGDKPCGIFTYKLEVLVGLSRCCLTRNQRNTQLDIINLVLSGMLIKTGNIIIKKSCYY